MLRIGIIGAENSHCASVAKLCNVEKLLPVRVVAVWGETPKYAKAAAADAQIPEIVKDWRQMLGKVDGVMIDHRHPKYHAEPATFYVEHGVPCFVDKPFTYTVAEGRKLCELARRERVPITSFSAIVRQAGFAAFKKSVAKLGPIASLTSTGPVDLKSKWGGVFFYGIHQVDAIVELLGGGAETACVMRHGKGGVAILTYKEGPMVTINCIDNGNWTWHWSVVGPKDILDYTHQYDASPYLPGTRMFTTMFRTGKEPLSHERILAPIAILEALAKSLKTGRRVKVADSRCS
jgi:predicted dehydrogenase